MYSGLKEKSNSFKHIPAMDSGEFQAFLNNSDDIIIATDPEGTIKFANLKTRRMLGYLAYELEEEKLINIVKDDHRSYAEEVFAKARRGMSVKDIKLILVGKQGQKIMVEGSLTPLLELRECTSLWVKFTTVTPDASTDKEIKKLRQKRFELEALKSLSDRLTNIFDLREAIKTINNYLSEVLEYSSAAYLIFSPEHDDGYVFINYFKEKVGKNYINAVKKDLVNHLTNERHKEIKAVMDKFVDIKPEIHGPRPGVKDKSVPRSQIIFPLKLGAATLGLIHISSREPNRYLGGTNWLIDAMIVTFVLFVVRLQMVLRAQRSRTETLVRSLSDGIIMFNDQLNITLMNKQGQEFTGLDPNLASLRDFYVLFPDVNLESKTTKMLVSGKTVRVNNVHLRSRHYEIFFTPVKDNQGKVVNGAIILHDITRLKEIDQMKTDFVYIASHQLRTPLTGIKWFIKLLEKEIIKNGRVTTREKECLEQITLSNNIVIKLVNDLLNVSRIETGHKFKIEKTNFDFSVLMKEILKDNVVGMEENKIIVKVKCCPKNLKLKADRTKIRQVIHNLITNGVKYSLSGGTVLVNAKADKKQVIISVKDSGIGIPKNQQQDIFSKFFRADNASAKGLPGSGLGLYMAKAVVEAHGGKMSFESVLNKGTIFTFTLPR